jgi:3-hydroxyisobutyryl-CoA hydrolase
VLTSSNEYYNCLSSHAGIATHFVPSQRIPELIDRVAMIGENDMGLFNRTIEEFSGEVGTFSLKPLLPVIEECFHASTVPTIIANVESKKLSKDPLVSAWAEKTLKLLNNASPTSLTVTLSMLRKGKNLSLKQCLTMELRLTEFFMNCGEFATGVTSKLITKSKERPAWKPSTIREITPLFVDSVFNFNYNEKGNFFISKDDFKSYPYNNGLPNESNIEQLIKRCKFQSQEDVLKAIQRDLVKPGLYEHVKAILERKTVLENGNLKWKEY